MKMMVGFGISADGYTTAMEVIDLENPRSYCSDLSSPLTSLKLYNNVTFYALKTEFMIASTNRNVYIVYVKFTIVKYSL